MDNYRNNRSNKKGTHKNEKTTALEFGGVVGTTMNVVALPCLVIVLNLMCNEQTCTFGQLPFIYNWWTYFIDWTAISMYLLWMMFQSLLAVLPIGKIHLGLPLKDGSRLQYRCNGYLSLLISIGAFLGAVHLGFHVSVIYDKFFQMMIFSIIFSYVCSVLLYVKSWKATPSKLSPGGNSGHLFYDFFIGRELNPRIGSFDLKFFCEMRPGLIGWVIINLSFVVKSYFDNFGPSPALLLVTIFQGFYVLDALWFEEAILSTTDIIHDGFGFMLCFGDLVWVPFLYTLQGKYLMTQSFNPSWYFLITITVVNLIGYYIFRASNSQKNTYRRNPKDPSVVHLKTIATPTNRRLLVSGWWGMCRKPNYLGDIIMSICWSLTCGFGSIIPYFYPIYFIILLIHRERRDSAACEKKYGDSWKKYCSIVKYRIFPYIY
ncbi:delta(14)-sterol reductase-like [Argonauta hians]